jgi:hypothetical protein
MQPETSHFEFRPSTRELFRLAGRDEPRPKKAQYLADERRDVAWQENYQLHSVALYMASRTFLGLAQEDDDRRYNDGTWPLDGAIVTALRIALAEHPEGSAGHDLAYLLLRAGIEDREVMDRLHPWDRLVFHWRDSGMRAADVLATLRAAGVCDDLDPHELAMIDAWIAEPISALDDWYPLLEALFGLQRRLVVAAVKDPDTAQHDKLLRELLSRAVPPVNVEGVSQSQTWEPADWVGPDRQAHVVDREWVSVRFHHAGSERELRFEGNGPCPNIRAVVSEVDRLLAGLGRRERVFELRQQRLTLPVHLFLVADADLFEAAAKRLHLPLIEPGADNF